MKNVIKNIGRFFMFVFLFVAFFIASLLLFRLLIEFCLVGEVILMTAVLVSLGVFLLSTNSLVNRSCKNMTGRSCGYLLILVFTLLFLMYVGGITKLVSRKKKSKSLNGLVICRNIIEYAENHEGYLPGTNKWCDLLLEYAESLPKSRFRLEASRAECDFALNKNVGGKKLENLPDNTVLVFGSKGDWNLSGDEELFDKRKSKHRFVFVYSRIDEINEATNDVDDIIVIDFKDEKYESVIWDPGEYMIERVKRGEKL